MSSNEDKLERVLEAIAQNPGLSDRAIAKGCGVSPTFVGKYRGDQGVWFRVGLDGRVHPAAPRARVYTEEGLAKSRPLLPEEEVLLKRVRAPEHVYVVLQDHLVKIGWSKNVEHRVGYLLGDCPGSTLVMLAAGGRRDEARVHAILASDRKHGEWFACSLEETEFAMWEAGLKPRLGLGGLIQV